MKRITAQLLTGTALLTATACIAVPARVPAPSEQPLSVKMLATSVAAPQTSVLTRSGQLLRQDFNAEGAWEAMHVSESRQVAGAIVSRKAVGTIDVAGTSTASGAAVVTMRGAEAAGIVSGLLPVSTKETNLAKLTLSFDHSVSSVRPVTVRIESFDAKRKRTGGREAVVYPAAPDFYLRSAVELSDMRPFGGGAFKPTDPFVQITFAVSQLPEGAAEPETTELRIDNIAYASPAFYVSPKGSDKNNGLTEKTAFATPQKAIDAAKPGDIVLVMDGTYTPHDVQEGVVAFRRGGTPDAWITLKNYPGQHPTFSPVGAWNAIRIGQRGTQAEPTKEAALAYIEVRGLHIRGDADVAKEKYADKIGKSDPFTNSNAFTITGRYESNIPHHIRIADNLMEYCAGGGTGGGNVDWMTIEDNIIRNNCWWMIYAGSGVSLLGTSNFDASDNTYKMLVRDNIVSGNRCFIAWGKIKKISDGNGIIIDTNWEPKKNEAYIGRTLIQNNLSFNNGGSGIHCFKSRRVDIINNTAYHNGASPELNWGQIFVQVADDVKIMNNILVSRPGQPINSVGKDGGDQNSTNIVRTHNIYFGGIAPKLTGDSDLIADPLFVNASTDFKVADFHVKPGSPAREAGIRTAFLPYLDLDGKPRPQVGAPDRGAYQIGKGK